MSIFIAFNLFLFLFIIKGFSSTISIFFLSKLFNKNIIWFYLGLHSLVYPPQVNGADYRVMPFASNLWKDAEGYYFVSVDTRYHNNNTSGYLGQCIGIQGVSATDPRVQSIAIWSCGITPSRKVLEFDATCLQSYEGS